MDKKFSLWGFPPISIVDTKAEKKVEDNKIRGFSKEEEQTVASLKDIMEKRRKEPEPFIKL